MAHAGEGLVLLVDLRVREHWVLRRAQLLLQAHLLPQPAQRLFALALHLPYHECVSPVAAENVDEVLLDLRLMQCSLLPAAICGLPAAICLVCLQLSAESRHRLQPAGAPWSGPRALGGCTWARCHARCPSSGWLCCAAPALQHLAQLAFGRARRIFTSQDTKQAQELRIGCMQEVQAAGHLCSGPPCDRLCGAELDGAAQLLQALQLLHVHALRLILALLVQPVLHVLSGELAALVPQACEPSEPVIYRAGHSLQESGAIWCRHAHLSCRR